MHFSIHHDGICAFLAMLEKSNANRLNRQMHLCSTGPFWVLLMEINGTCFASIERTPALVLVQILCSGSCRLSWMRGHRVVCGTCEVGPHLFQCMAAFSRFLTLMPSSLSLSSPTDRRIFVSYMENTERGCTCTLQVLISCLHSA